MERSRRRFSTLVLKIDLVRVSDGVGGSSQIAVVARDGVSLGSIRANIGPMSENGVADAIATVGLFLTFTAIIASVICAAGWGLADAYLGTVAGVIAVVSFAAGMGCFRAQARERRHEQLSVS